MSEMLVLLISELMLESRYCTSISLSTGCLPCVGGGGGVGTGVLGWGNSTGMLGVRGITPPWGRGLPENGRLADFTNCPAWLPTNGLARPYTETHALTLNMQH